MSKIEESNRAEGVAYVQNIRTNLDGFTISLHIPREDGAQWISLFQSNVRYGVIREPDEDVIGKKIGDS